LKNSTLAIEGAVFDIQTDAGITDPAEERNSYVLNSPGSTLKKTGGSGTTTIAVKTFTNSAIFQLFSGIVKLDNFESQQTMTVGTVTTKLSGGSLVITNTYYVYGGYVEGAGTITGNIWFGKQNGPLITASTGVLRP